jgi:hypothetical protein
MPQNTLQYTSVCLTGYPRLGRNQGKCTLQTETTYSTWLTAEVRTHSISQIVVWFTRSKQASCLS